MVEVERDLTTLCAFQRMVRHGGGKLLTTEDMTRNDGSYVVLFRVFGGMIQCWFAIGILAS